MTARKYSGDSIEITYEPARCIHAAECVKGLPSVFDPNKMPWVNPGAASPEEIASAVAKCPTGALRAYVQGQDAVTSPHGNTVAALENGPVVVQGQIVLTLKDGSVQKESRLALCRCGASRHKPFCDGNHTKAGFEAPGVPAAPMSGNAGELNISLAGGGPALLNGNFSLAAKPGEVLTKGAVCRCGASQNKPMCDGAHKAVDFDS